MSIDNSADDNAQGQRGDGDLAEPGNRSDGEGSEESENDSAQFADDQSG